MKINKILIMLFAVAGLTFTSCVEDNDYTAPAVTGTEENKELNKILNLIETNAEWNLVSIADLKAQYKSGGDPVKITSNDVVKGYVVSSDQSGNFYKEFFIQDAPENPTAGIKVALNLVSSYNKFNIGREVYISLKDLYIGEGNSGDGIISIGGKVKISDTNEVDLISENQSKLHIFRSSVKATIVPTSISIGAANASKVGTYVRIENVFFGDDLEGESYIDSKEDYDTQRKLEGCNGFGYAELLVETSSFANFGKSKITTGKGGYIEGIISKDYKGENVVLVLNNLDGVVLNETKCSLANEEDFKAVFEEDFQSVVKNRDINISGWTNLKEEGKRVWQGKKFSGNGYAEFSAYKSKDKENVAWLITPAINMDAQEGEYLNFKSAQHHLEAIENTLEVFVSTDFDGTNANSATWNPVQATLPSKANKWYKFKDSGLIDISSYTGNLYVAFKYTGDGTDETLDGSYMVDDVKVLISK